MQNVSVEWLANECEFTTAYIRQLLLRGRIQGEKIDGKSWSIDLDNPCNREFFNKNKKDTKEKKVEFSQEKTELHKKESQEFQQNNASIVIELLDEIKKLSFEAGKTALLSDNLRQKEHDVEYWKTNFFELQNKYEQLLKENIELKNRTIWRYKLF